MHNQTVWEETGLKAGSFPACFSASTFLSDSPPQYGICIGLFENKEHLMTFLHNTFQRHPRHLIKHSALSPLMTWLASTSFSSILLSCSPCSSLSTNFSSSLCQVHPHLRLFSCSANRLGHYSPRQSQGFLSLSLQYGAPSN